MQKIILGLCGMVLLQGCTSSVKPSQEAAPTYANGSNEKPSAKDMFLDDGGAGAKGLSVVAQDSDANTSSSKNRQSNHVGGPVTKYQGLSYWIEKVGRSDTQRVTASTVFHNGDRIRFHLRSNRSGYLYVVTQGTSGRSSYLFPTKAGESEYIEANRNYTIPSQAAIVFDAHPGKEVIWLFLSKQPLPVDGTAQAAAQGNAVSSNVVALNNCGSKDLLIASPEAIQNQCGPKSGGQSKDILVEDDTSTAEAAGYAVMPQEQIEQGAMLSLKLELRHE